MQLTYTAKNLSLLIILLFAGFTQTMAQARYKHLPRVRIEKTVTEEKPVIPALHEEVNAPLSIENNESKQEAVIPEATEVATITPDNIVLLPDQSLTEVKQKITLKEKKDSKDFFTESVKKKSYLMEVKEVKQVKKTNIIGYLLWFLIVLLLGIALFVLAFIFLGIIAYSLYYVFLVFGIVGLTIALLILIFGLTGIIA